MPRALLAAVIALTTSACRQSELATGVSDSTFVRVMASLRQLPVADVPDTMARGRSRDSILRVNGVTAAQIESAAVSLASDPARASNVWNAIEQHSTASKPGSSHPMVPQMKNGAAK
jgi:hypothetical protein